MARENMEGSPQNPWRLSAEGEISFQQLKADAKEHGLVLFVGSGINGTALPQWNDLLTELLKQALDEAAIEDSRIESLGLQDSLLSWVRSNFDVCAQASIVKYILGAERYRIEIQDILYKQIPDVEKKVTKYCQNIINRLPEEDKKYKYLETVARLCLLPHVRAVATFNFDTLLESAIKALGTRTPRAYFGQVASFDTENFTEGDIPIYHIHGLLSPPETLLRNPNENIVLSYDEYFNKNADPLSWETASSLHFLRNFCTLWLGVSLRDWNMIRLLDSARSGRREVRSYCLQCREEVKPGSGPDVVDPLPYREIAMRFQATLLDAVGMHLIVSGSQYEDIPKIISKYLLDNR